MAPPSELGAHCILPEKSQKKKLYLQKSYDSFQAKYSKGELWQHKTIGRFLSLAAATLEELQPANPLQSATYNQASQKGEIISATP